MARRKIKTLSELREIGNHAVEAAKNALREGANTVAADAKSRVAVKTGKLKDSIKVQSRNNGTVYRVSADAFKTDSHGKKYYYGRRIEFDPEINKRFLYPALDAHREEIYKNVDEAVHNAIRGE